MRSAMQGDEAERRSQMQGLSLRSSSPALQIKSAACNGWPFPNETLNSTTWPQTPHRTAPNSARKRLHTPVLFRKTASPSHTAKMSTLFEEAGSTLQSAMTLSPRSSSNVKKSRTPSSQTRFIKFGSANCVDSTLVSGPFWEHGDDGGAATFKRAGQGYETIDCPSIHSPPATPSRLWMTAKDWSVNKDYPSLPSPQMNTDPVEFVAAIQATPKFSNDAHAHEPISSGFATPINDKSSYSKPPPTLLHRSYRSWNSQKLSNPAEELVSDDGEPFTHGTRLIMPYTHCETEEAQQANIDSWLEEVFDANSEDLQAAHHSRPSEVRRQATQPMLSLGESARDATSKSDIESTPVHEPPSLHSSNKENVPPPLPPRSRPPLNKLPLPIPSRFRSGAHQSMTLLKTTSSATKFVHPTSPRRYLSAPPKRKRSPVNDDAGTPSKPERPKPQDFTIHDDDLAVALAKLGPSVECHRKGQGPKRERCASYWDIDVLDVHSPAYPVQVLTGTAEKEGKLLRNGKRVLDERAKGMREQPIPTEPGAPIVDSKV